MPAPETSFLTETVSLWAPSGAVSADGRRKVVAGVQIPARWEDRKGELGSRTAEPVLYDAWIAVAQRVAVGSILFRGTLAEYEDQPAANPSGLYEAVYYSEAADVKGRNVRREVRLARYRKPLPEVV